MSAFEGSFSIRKEFLKKEVNGEIAFALISLLHVKTREPASRSTTTWAFAFLAKFFKLSQNIWNKKSMTT